MAPKIRRMGHAAVEVKNVDKALDFYCGLLGLEKKWVGDDDWASVSAGPDDLSLVRAEGSVHPPHFGFRVDSEKELEEFHALLVGAGHKPDAIRRHRDASVSFYFKDPDGNLLEALWDNE